MIKGGYQLLDISEHIIDPNLNDGSIEIPGKEFKEILNCKKPILLKFAFMSQGKIEYCIVFLNTISETHSKTFYLRGTTFVISVSYDSYAQKLIATIY